MTDIREVLKLTDHEALRREVRERAALREMMVGSLYPSILESEIERLLNRIEELKREGTCE